MLMKKFVDDGLVVDDVVGVFNKYVCVYFDFDGLGMVIFINYGNFVVFRVIFLYCFDYCIGNCYGMFCWWCI